MKKDKEKIKEEFKKRLYSFILKLINFVDSLPKNDRVCWVVGDQLLRSGTSIGANYVEAQIASSKKDFINFFHHSLKSANESKFWLALLRDSGRGNKARIKELLEGLSEISNILGSSLLTLKGKR